MQNKALLRGGVGLAALALAAAACGSSGGAASGGGSAHSGSASASMSPMASPSGAAGSLTNTAAAQLYAGLDQLLVEHVDLTANVVQAAITKGAVIGADQGGARRA